MFIILQALQEDCDDKDVHMIEATRQVEKVHEIMSVNKELLDRVKCLDEMIKNLQKEKVPSTIMCKIDYF
jgi:urease gamma subunit